MRTILRPSVVLLAVLALVLVGAGAFMARLDGASAAGGGPEMRLTANGCTADCTFATGESFTLAVEAVTAPVNGYVGVQSFIDYGPDLTYDSSLLSASDEIVWPDCESVIALRAETGPNLVTHGCLTGLIPPLPVNNHVGNLVELSMTCSSGNSTTEVQLLTRGDVTERDPGAINIGTAFSTLDGTVLTKVSGLLIHCGAGGPLDTPAPTAQQTLTPTATPTPSPTFTPAPTSTLGPTAIPPSVGDVNCDNSFDSIDAALILQQHARLILELSCPQDLDVHDSDVNGDGRTNSVDAALIMQYAAGYLATLPP